MKILKHVDKNHGELSLMLDDDLNYNYDEIMNDLSKNNTFSKRTIPGI
jgi:hypothetical protein